MAKRTIGVPIHIYDEIQALRERLMNFEITQLEHDETFKSLISTYLPNKDHLSDDDVTEIKVRRAERIYLGR